jgi:hypothetical protein
LEEVRSTEARELECDSDEKVDEKGQADIVHSGGRTLKSGGWLLGETVVIMFMVMTEVTIGIVVIVVGG